MVMRTPTIASINYAPSQVPDDPAEIPRFLTSELIRIKATMDLLALGHLDPTYVAPAKPRDGDIRLCDGTSWNPLGTGQKFVGYRGGAWVLLG